MWHALLAASDRSKSAATVQNFCSVMLRSVRYNTNRCGLAVVCRVQVLYIRRTDVDLL